MSYPLLASDYEANLILNSLMGGAAYSPAGHLWIRAYSTSLTAAGVGSELTVDGYAPTDIVNNTTNFPTTTTRAKANAVLIETTVFNEDCEIKAFGLWDASTAGHLRYYASFPSTPIEIIAGQTRQFGIGDITMLL